MQNARNQILGARNYTKLIYMTGRMEEIIGDISLPVELNLNMPSREPIMHVSNPTEGAIVLKNQGLPQRSYFDSFLSNIPAGETKQVLFTGSRDISELGLLQLERIVEHVAALDLEVIVGDNPLGVDHAVVREMLALGKGHRLTVVGADKIRIEETLREAQEVGQTGIQIVVVDPSDHERDRFAKRDKKMVEMIDRNGGVVCGIWNGISPGTKGTFDYAQQCGLKTAVFNEMAEHVRLRREEIRNEYTYSRQGHALAKETTNLALEVLKDICGKLDIKGKSAALCCYGSIARQQMMDCSDLDLFFFHDQNKLDLRDAETLQTQIQEILSRGGFQRNKVIFHPWDYIEKAIKTGNMSAKLMYILSHVSFIAGDESACPAPSEEISQVLKDPDLLLQELMISKVFKRPEDKVGQRNVKYSPGMLRDIDCIIRRLKFIDVDLLSEFQCKEWKRLPFSEEENEEILMEADEVEKVYNALDFIYALRNELHCLRGEEEDFLSESIQEQVAAALGMSPEELLTTFDVHAKNAQQVSQNVQDRMFLHLTSRKEKDWQRKYEDIETHGSVLDQAMQIVYAKDDDPTIRLSVVMRTRTPATFQAILDYEDRAPNWFVSTAITLNENAPYEILAQVAEAIGSQAEDAFWKQTRSFLRAHSNYKKH